MDQEIREFLATFNEWKKYMKYNSYTYFEMFIQLLPLIFKK